MVNLLPCSRFSISDKSTVVVGYRSSLPPLVMTTTSVVAAVVGGKVVVPLYICEYILNDERCRANRHKRSDNTTRSSQFTFVGMSDEGKFSSPLQRATTVYGTEHSSLSL